MLYNNTRRIRFHFRTFLLSTFYYFYLFCIPFFIYLFLVRLIHILRISSPVRIAYSIGEKRGWWCEGWCERSLKNLKSYLKMHLIILPLWRRGVRVGGETPARVVLPRRLLSVVGGRPAAPSSFPKGSP